VNRLRESIEGWDHQVDEPETCSEGYPCDYDEDGWCSECGNVDDL